VTSSTDKSRSTEAEEAVAASLDARSLSSDPLISASLAVIDAYTIDLDEATANQQWAIRVAHKHGASLRQLAEVSGLHRNTISKIVNSNDTAAA